MNDLREAIEFSWYILTAVISALVTLLTYAFTFGRKMEKLATKEELKDYLPRHEFEAHALDLKSDLQEIKSRQSTQEELNEKRHSQIIDILINKDGGK